MPSSNKLNSSTLFGSFPTTDTDSGFLRHVLLTEMGIAVVFGRTGRLTDRFLYFIAHCGALGRFQYVRYSRWATSHVPRSFPAVFDFPGMYHRLSPGIFASPLLKT